MRDQSPKPEREEVPVSTPDPIVLEEVGESPTVEVRVWRHGKLLHRELCESAGAATDVVDAWSDIEGVECEVDDTSVQHTDEEILQPSAPRRQPLHRRSRLGEPTASSTLNR